MQSLREIDVGFDRFHAQVIADHCADEGVTGELLLYDETRYEIGMSGRVPNRFLVKTEDEPVVRRVMADLYPDMVFESQPDIVHATSPSMRTRFIAVLVFVCLAGPVLFGLLYLLG